MVELVRNPLKNLSTINESKAIWLVNRQASIKQCPPSLQMMFFFLYMVVSFLYLTPHIHLKMGYVFVGKEVTEEKVLYGDFYI